VRVGDASYRLCPGVFPADVAARLKQPEALGRLNVTTASGLRADGSCYRQITAFGARSFSVFSPDGTLVFDSGSAFEQTVARLVADGTLPEEAFNATHDESPSGDSRSDDKGVEPEGVAVGEVGGRTYAFVGLERIGGLMVYDITDPARSTFVQYVNNRDFTVAYEDDGEGSGPARDLGAEGVEFIAAKDSPNGRPLVAVANEVSGTTTLFRVDQLVSAPAQG